MRRILIGLAVAGFMAAVLGLATQKTDKTLLLLDWANKANDDKPPVAVLIEFGLKDKEPTDWNSKAVLAGAKVVHREGYRFRDGDRLVEPDGWQAKSRRPIRVPANNPAAARLEGIVSVGVVLHLADVKDDAKLTLDPADSGDEKAVVDLKGVLAGKAKEVWGGKAVVRRISTTTALTTGKTEDDFPAAAYGPDGTLWVAYISYTLKDESRRIEQHALKEQPKDFKAFYTPEFGDQLFVKSCRAGKWSEPVAVTGPNEDLVRCAVAVEGNGDAWVIYSANRKGAHDIYARRVGPKLGTEDKLTDGDAVCLTGCRSGSRGTAVGSSSGSDACAGCSGGVTDCSALWAFRGEWWLPTRLMRFIVICCPPQVSIAPMNSNPGQFVAPESDCLAESRTQACP